MSKPFTAIHVAYNYIRLNAKSQPANCPQLSPSVTFKLIDMTNLPPNFISWHYQTALPNFINSRITQLSSTYQLFSVANLIKNLFTPYRRMAISGKEEKFGAQGLFDKLTFNLVSIFVGFAVRIVLLATWVFSTIALALLNLVLIIL